MNDVSSNASLDAAGPSPASDGHVCPRPRLWQWRTCWFLLPLAIVLTFVHMAIPRWFSRDYYPWAVGASGVAFAAMTLLVVRIVSGALGRAMDRAETARRRAHRLACENHDKYRQLFATVSDAILVFDPQTARFVDANEAALALYGYSREEFLTLERTGISAEPEQSCEALEAVLAGTLRRIPLRLHRKKDGTVFPVEISASRALWNGRTMVCTINRDITERQLLEGQLLQARKMEAVGQLAGGIAHDFRNQLMVIKGFGEMLLRRQLVAPEGLDKVREILAAAERSALLTGQLLAFGRRQVLQPRRADLGALVTEASKAIARLLGESVALSIVSDAHDHPVEIDPGQFHQALFNVVANARDAMPDGGQLTIRIDRVVPDDAALARHAGLRAGPYVRLSLRDTGCGMDQATLGRIFEPFFTTKPVGSGTGLGLATVYGFVAQSGGFMDVDSAPGAGTTVSLHFPAV